jgi:predicted MFS family arabinose efflux permease
MQYDRSASAVQTLDPASSLSLGLTLILAVACGVAVASIYFSQPLLNLIEARFSRKRSVAAFVPTATQIGYAVGLLLLVPLGDCIERRRLILTQIVVSAINNAGDVSGYFVGVLSRMSRWSRRRGRQPR